MTRLSIVDLKTGEQPISSEDSRISLICNGEIYNSAELREHLIALGHRFQSRCDVEVIVHLYEEYGVNYLSHLRGMFAIALWDDRLGRLLLARDRLGIKPLHYAVTGDACYFGSEQKAIIASGEIEPRLDVDSLADLMSLGLVPSPRTLFTGIQRLPPAHYLLYEGGRATLHEYWDVDFAPDDRRWSARDWADALREQLTESVRSHLMSDVPIGAWLSAGIDSSSIVALMNRLGQGAIPTVTLAFDHSDYDETGTQQLLYDFPGYDLDVSRAVCGAGDIALLPKAVWHTEDLVTGGVEIPRMLLARAASEKVKVVLTGEGADEMLGGYDFFRLEKFLRPFARVPRSLRASVSRIGRSRYPRGSLVNAAPGEMRMERYRSLTAPVGRDAATTLDREIQGQLSRSAEARANDELRLPDAFASWDSFSQLQYYEMKIRLPDRIESILDRASMAYSLEARVPFLDHVLVEFCAKIPASVKMDWLTEKQVLRDAMRDVLPRELSRRRKRGLASPTKHWMREPLPDFAQELLSDAALREKGYFDPAAVAQLRSRPGQKKKRQSSGHLMSVLRVQLWDELFVQRRDSWMT